jgi:hypothetical protein
VANTPNVNVGNTPNVNVANAATNPIPVADAENPARQAVQQEIDINVPAGGGDTKQITIPKGRIFVLETVSINVQATTGTIEGVAIAVNDQLITGGLGAATYLLSIPPNTSLFLGSQALRLYAQPETPLTVTFVVSDKGGGRCIVALSGYYVNTQ